MRLRKLEIQEKSLDDLFISVSKLEDDNEIKSHLAKYLCIQASGYLENVIKELLAEFHDKTCKKETESFVNEKLKNFTNIDEKKIESLLVSFNREWYQILQSRITEQQLTSLNNIVSQRNLIAHGKSNLSNISYSYMTQYYNDLKAIVKELRLIIRK